jgi:hypothetical protein
LVDSLTEDSRIYHWLSFPQCYFTLEVGKPQLPVMTELIAVPGHANVSVCTIDSTAIHVGGFDVYPCQRPLLEGQKRIVFDRDDEFYTTDRFWPEEVVTLGEPSIWRDMRVVLLRICPFKYNPRSRELLVYTKLIVKLEYTPGSDRNTLDYSNRVITPAYDKIYRKNILNYGFMNLPRNSPAKQDYSLLIITMDEFYQTMLPFHDFKEDICGIETNLRSYYDLGVDTPEELREYIRGEYNNHNIEFVLLVGDISDIPTYGGYTYGDDQHMISDYYYTLLAGSDLYPEVAVGRFSVEYNSEAYNMESKTRHFLMKNPTQNEWLNKALLVAHCEGAPNNYQGCKEEIRNRVYAHPPVFDVCYGAGGGTNADVIARIHDGRGIVNYRGHGSSECWTTWNNLGESFCKGEVDYLANDSLTPIVLGIACWTNKLDQPELCLGEKFTLVEDAAVAYHGSSRPSHTSANNTYDEKIFEELFDNEGGYLGNAINAASRAIIDGHGENGEANAKMYILLGDPSITYPPLVNPDSTPDTTYIGIVIDTTEAMAGEMQNAVDFLIELIQKILQVGQELIALLPNPENPGNPWPRVPPTPDPNAIIEALEDLVNDVYIDTSYINDAICKAVDFIEDQADTSSTRIIFVTAGGKHDSGQCAGLNDPAPPWDDYPGSWQYQIWNKVMSEGVIIDVIFYGNRDSASKDNDAAFLHDLALASGGGWYDPADTAVCGNGLLETGEDCEYDSDCTATDGSRGVTYCDPYCKCLIDCQPGNCNGDGVINILDITYLISYLYKGGQVPIPYQRCSGDPNCNCVVNIIDITYLINFIYKGGPAPCSRPGWIDSCGPPAK